MKKINLREMHKQDPFMVPDGYLDRLPQLIQETGRMMERLPLGI